MSDLYILSNTLRDMVRLKRLSAVVLLVVLPAVIAAFIKSVSTSILPLELYNNFMQFLVFGFVLVILSVIFGTGVITQEVEQKTIVYLLTRPTPRWRILLMKYLAVAILTILTSWLAALTLGLATVGPEGFSTLPLARDFGMLCIGALAYGALFLLLATLLTRPLLFGLLYAFGWESWMPSMPGKFKYLSLMAYLRVLAPHVKQQQMQINPLNPFAYLLTDSIPRYVAWAALIGIIVGGLGAALVFFSVREFVPREEAA